MIYPKKLYLIAAGAIVGLSVSTASAQLNVPGISLHGDSRPLDSEEEAKRKAVDDAYKSAMEKIPDQKKSNDPWGSVRSTTTTTSSKKQRNDVK